MSLTKDDFKEIEKIVEKSETRMVSLIKDTKNEIITTISREVTDLAEINRAVIHRVDKIADLEKRVTRIENKVGIVS